MIVCAQVGRVVLSAGQIGLNPAHMTMVPPLAQASVSLAHVESVLKACHASLTSVLCGTCYYITEEARCTARRALSEVITRSLALYIPGIGANF